MVPFQSYIMVIALFLIFNKELNAQNAPWTSPLPTANTSPLIINSIPRVNGQTLAEGDFIGVFDSQGRCFGMAKWKDTINFGIMVYGTDGVNDGFRNGDTLNLKVWLKNENCIIDRILQVSTERPLVFSNALMNRINQLNFARLSVNYPRERFCMNEELISPAVNYKVDDLRFLSAQGIDLDVNSGSVDPEGSIPGNYTVTLASSHCLSQKQLSITLNDYPRIEKVRDTSICGDRTLKISLDGDFSGVQWSNGQTTREIELSEPSVLSYRVMNIAGCSNTDTFRVRKKLIKRIDFTVDKADCYERGTVQIRDSEIESAGSSYTFQLKSRLVQKDSFELADVPEGIYSIEVINDDGCILEHKEIVVIEKDCLNDNPVFSPNDDEFGQINGVW